MSNIEPTQKVEVMHHWKFRLDVVLALCALVTTVTTVWLSISQGDDMRRLVQAQSWPYVDVGRSNLRRNPVNNQWEDVQLLTLENKGVGPAKIRNFRLIYAGQEIRGFAQLLTLCCGYQPTVSEDPDLGLVTSAVEGQVLRPGDKVDAFLWGRPSAQDPMLHKTPLTAERAAALDDVWWRFNKERWQLSIELCYCSVFDECWQVDKEPKPVPACPANLPSRTAKAAPAK